MFQDVVLITMDYCCVSSIFVLIENVSKLGSGAV